MIPVRFAFSFNREYFEGDLDTRQDALKTALNKVPLLEYSPAAVFVGKRVPVDPGSSGLAEMILGAMRRRLREQTDEVSNDGYLMRVNEHQLAELDTEIDRAIRAWQQKHNLAPTQSRIVAISEHPIPHPDIKPADRNGNEVSDLGQGDYPVFLS